jgi:SAM-dependent methyltransferase
MHFVIRNKDFIFTETVLPGDDVLTSNGGKVFQDYIQETKVLCGPYSECKFPQSYFGNIRPWDYERILEYGDFAANQKVLECGGLHSYFAIATSQKVNHYTCTDSFYWATRDYAQNPQLQSPQEWCKYLIGKGRGKLHAEEADLQSMKYANEQFDRVVCISVIEHVHEDRKGILEMMRVLKPGGLLLLTTEYNPTWSKPYAETDGSYYRVYDQSDLSNLLAGLDVEVMQAQGGDVRDGQFTTTFIRIRK